jgi:hypothetical protein
MKTDALVTAPHVFPAPVDGYHWSKLKSHYDPALIKTALETDKRFENVKNLIDNEKDIVGFWFTTPNMAVARNAIKKLLGKNHGLMVFEGASDRSARTRQIQALRQSST